MSLLSSLSSNPRGLIGFIFGLFVRHMGNPFSGILLAIEFVGSLRCELILCESPKLFFVVRNSPVPTLMSDKVLTLQSLEYSANRVLRNIDSMGDFTGCERVYWVRYEERKNLLGLRSSTPRGPSRYYLRMIRYRWALLVCNSVSL